MRARAGPAAQRLAKYRRTFGPKAELARKHNIVGEGELTCIRAMLTARNAVAHDINAVPTQTDEARIVEINKRYWPELYGGLEYKPEWFPGTLAYVMLLSYLVFSPAEIVTMGAL